MLLCGASQMELSTMSFQPQIVCVCLDSQWRELVLVPFFLIEQYLRLESKIVNQNKVFVYLSKPTNNKL